MTATAAITKALPTVEPAQQVAAKVAGAWYLLAMAGGVFAEVYARGRLIVRGDAAQTATNIAAAEGLFRAATISHLIVFAGDVILTVSLYVILRSINRNLALLAAAWRFLACCVLAVVMLGDFAILGVLRGADSLRAFDTAQRQALVQLFYRVEGAGFQIGFVFLGLGSTLFAYLWFQSRFVPRALAAWGMFASLVLSIGTLLIMAFPALSVVGLAYMFPMGVYEVGLGIWLLARGLRPPRSMQDLP